MPGHVGYLANVTRFLSRGRGEVSAPISGFAAIDHAGIDHLGGDHLASLLNGSWFLQFVTSNPSNAAAIRGPLRIDGVATNPRISGDIYVRAAGDGAPGAEPVETIPSGSLVIGDNWYPAFPQRQYAWYFRGIDAMVDGDELRAMIERHIWDPDQSRFVQTDLGGLVLTLQSDPVAWPGLPKPAPILRGEAMIAGEAVQVIAVKTSDFYRGCIVEVDVMSNRRWPERAMDVLGTRTFTFQSIYREAGFDAVTQISEVDIPEDAALSPLEAHNLLRDHRKPTTMPDAWRMWVLVGSSWQNSPGTLGIMFDSEPPHREGCIGFFDPRFSRSTTNDESIWDKTVGEIDLAFLRTLVHEAGHTLNLLHPKDDAHGVQIGTTIMNQTGDIQRQATTVNRFPNNVSMSFNDHNRTALTHAPDPQIKPGWLQFGWGHHASVSIGIEEPVGLAGLNTGTIPMSDLELTLDLPKDVHRGEVVVANLTLRNTTDRRIDVSNALNLAQDDLEIVAIGPDQRKRMPRDVVKICGVHEMLTLAAGDEIESAVQLFFNNGEFTFSDVGTYEVWARFRPTGDPRRIVESIPQTIVVRNSVTRKEQELETLMLDDSVGLCVAFGDFGADDVLEKKMKKIAESYEGSDTGAVCAMVVSNSLGKAHRDVRTGAVCREADRPGAEAALKDALTKLSAQKAVRLAMATVSPRSNQAPLLALLEAQMKASGSKNADGEVAIAAKLKKVGMRV